MSIGILDSKTASASFWGTNQQPGQTRLDQDIDPCELLPPGGEISSQNDTTCVGQYGSEPGERVVQIQAGIVLESVKIEDMCAGLLEPSDFRVFMSEVDYGDCGIQAESSYKGEPAPGYMGWQILYYYKRVYVRVATSQDYPANQSWVYDTAEAIEKIIQDSLEPAASSDPTNDLPADSPEGERKSEEECAQMQQEVADLAGIANGPEESDLKLGIIGEVVVQHGTAFHDYCTGGEGSLSENSQIKIGDCIRTRSDGDLIIQLNDWNEDRNIGRSIILLAADSEICFEEFDVGTAPVRRTTLISLVEGALRAITKGWKNGSIFKVEAGTTVCGGRGTEFFVSYLPGVDLFYTELLEGQLDVSSEATGDTETLTDYQYLVVSEGDMVSTGPITQEQWDANLEDSGLRDEDFPELGNIEDEIIIEDIPEIGDIEDEQFSEPEPQFPPIPLALILGIVCLCTIILIIIIVGAVLLARKRSK